MSPSDSALNLVQAIVAFGFVAVALSFWIERQRR